MSRDPERYQWPEKVVHTHPTVFDGARYREHRDGSIRLLPAVKAEKALRRTRAGRRQRRETRRQPAPPAPSPAATSAGSFLQYNERTKTFSYKPSARTVRVPRGERS